MNKILILIIIFLFNSNQSFAQQVGFASLGSTYKPDPNTPVYEIQNMPRIRSQDSLGICYGFAAHTLFQFEICKEKKIDCKNVDLKNEASLLRITAWTHPDNENENYADPSYRRNIQLQNGGVAINALTALSESSEKGEYAMQDESCFEFDKFANTIGKDEKKTNELIAMLESEFNKYKKTESDYCFNCLAQQIKKDLGIHFEEKMMKAKLNVPNFSRFLYSIILSRCRNLTDFKISSKFVGYSKARKSDLSYNAVLNKIKEVIINKKKPVSIDNICMKIGPDGKCSDYHSTVISGYKKMCNSNGCRDMLKIHNSWGQGWQDASDGGWVDALTMLNPKYSEVAIGWFE